MPSTPFRQRVSGALLIEARAASIVRSAIRTVNSRCSECSRSSSELVTSSRPPSIFLTFEWMLRWKMSMAAPVAARVVPLPGDLLLGALDRRCRLFRDLLRDALLGFRDLLHDLLLRLHHLVDGLLHGFLHVLLRHHAAPPVLSCASPPVKNTRPDCTRCRVRGPRIFQLLDIAGLGWLDIRRRRRHSLRAAAPGSSPVARCRA